MASQYTYEIILANAMYQYYAASYIAVSQEITRSDFAHWREFVQSLIF